MQYYKCKCGKSEAWGSDSPRNCEVCPDCSTTLLRNADGGFIPAVPHELVREVDQQHGKPTISLRCMKCYQKFPDDPKAETISPDSEHVQAIRAWLNQKD